MEPRISFTFRHRQYTALYTICEREFPIYIYITLLDAELATEFGEEMVIHCSAEGLMTDSVYTDHREQLYRTIFDAIVAEGSVKLNNTSHVNQ